ncbi:hypothetical protein [Pseudomonas virus PBPA162]|uniref:Uncharacterized protein n=1 Tax=Pseudomonas virus PBPA162 TaxID=2588096 RepID=A0A4Y5TQJ7_9CAUD|nr:hypothetical protein PQC32_gp17 [Pseudomonas virus PBPA162]QDB70851.1 hypothetical protein [Pseudomonas virus PBPA162]
MTDKPEQLSFNGCTTKAQAANLSLKSASDGRILAAKPSPVQSEQAEAEQPEVVARVVHSNPVVLAQCGPLNANDELMTVAQHAASVASWAEMFNRVEQERDAALARAAELEAAISSALSQHGVKFMDPPDGGDVPLIEQLYRMSQALSELEKPDPDYTQHPQIVGYARKKELAPLLDPCQPDGSYIYIGLDHPACWAEEAPYEFLIPLYAAPVTPALPEDVRVLLSRAQAEIEYLAECLENVCEDDEELDVAQDIKESIAVADKIAHLIASAPVSKTAAPVQDESSLPDVCDGKEQDAFEEWATKQGMNMQCHPMHWLFLDTKTMSARQGWKAALKYVRAHIAAVSAKSQQRVPDDVETFLNEVRAELLRARSKFPGDRIMTIALAEEFGELCKAVLDEPAANVRKEAVQTAVMAARVVLDGDGSVTAWRAERGLDPLTAPGKEGPNE